MAEMVPSATPVTATQIWTLEDSLLYWKGEMAEDRKAQAWIEIKKLEKDFFLEFQFVSGKVRKARHESRVSAIQSWSLLGMLVLVLLLTCFWK